MKQKGLRFKKPCFMLFMLLIAAIAFGANAWAAEVDHTDPAPGATGVPVPTNVTVTFYTDMDSTTLNANTFFVTTGTAYNLKTVTGTISYSDTVAIFSPAAPLENNTAYKATVTTGAKDANGGPLATDYVWTFTTAGSSDSLISSTAPAGGSAGVPVNTTVAVTFSEAMNTSTLENAFSLKAGSGYGMSNVPVTMTYNAGNNTATFTPATALYNSTTYTAMVTTDAKSAAGYSLEADYSWSFTTVEGGTEHLRVTSVSPVNNAIAVDVNTVIKAVFSKEMNPSTINRDTFYVVAGIGYDLQAIAGEVSYSGVTATFTPASPLDYESVYTAVVTTDAKDMDGNPIGYDFEWVFTTEEGGGVHPTVTSVDVHEDRLTITFSSEMDPSSVEESLMIKLLIPGIGYGIVAGKFSYNGTTATFMPYSDFIPGASYEITITGARDTEGNYLKFDGSTFTGKQEAHWGYEGDVGPEHWGDLGYPDCGLGMEQSPVDIPEAAAVNPSDIMFKYKPVALNIVNNGHTVKANYDEGSTVEVDGKEYNLLQFHFHAPSEHTINGQHFDMEMHLVHQNADGKYAVVGVMIGRGDKNPAYETVWANMPEEEGEPETIDGAIVNAAELLPANRTYYQYGGSFTTPPCTEGINWILLNTPIELSDAQISAFEAIYHNNNRPVQPINDREFMGAENNIDNDNDGYTENQGDCNDANADISPDADEILNDGIDQNCDGHDDAGFALEDFVTREALAARLEKLEEISVAHADTGYRLSGTAGYDAGIDYVKEGLEAVGYVFIEQPVEFRFFEELEDPVFGQVSPNQVAYALGDDFSTQTYSGSGDVTAEIAFVTPIIPMDIEADPSTSTDGCEVEDFEGIDLTGKIAVIQRGDCYYRDKAKNAEDAGAIGAIIFNEGQTGRQDQMGGTLGNESEISIPVIATSYQIGAALYDLAQTGSVEIHMTVTASDETRTSNNIITETPGGNSEQVIMVGAHMDGVSPAPATNDNGSGTIAVFELAYQMAQQGFNPVNKVRFAWWSVEEQGKVGSGAYLDSLSEDERAKIGMYLNFDMLGSNNYAILVYDGDVSDTAEDPNNSSDMSDSVLRPESGAVEQVFLDYFASEDIAAFPQALSGRSDYYDFVLYGIPFGGAWSGADVLKTEEQAAVYGGTVGEQYDTCYHKLCDDMENLNMDAMTSISKSAAHATQYFAQDVKLFDGLPPAPGTRRAAYKEDRVKTKDRVFKYDRHHSDRHLYSVE
ncbi:MAG: M28 family peptidase [Desulfobacteraceae bacterium]|nr:M28 family peptidase [Desulfobacteraceae bacterium]